MSQSPSTTNETSPQTTCTVTNNLLLPTHPSTSAQTGWNGEIVAISNTAGSAIAASLDNPQLAGATDFALLTFSPEDSAANCTTNPPGNPLPVGKTASLTLPDDPEPTTASEIISSYNLVFAQANNYFPVATIAGVVTSNTPADIVLPMAVPQDTNSGANAYRFMQAIMVDPCSPMAQQFTEAMLADVNANPATGSCANVNAFFAQTNDFKNVDFAIYSAVNNYASTYAFVWADFQPEFTYTIYTTTATVNASDGDATAANVKLSPLGTVIFSQRDSCTPPLSDANAGYSITWKPKEGSAVDLTIMEGQLVNQADGDFKAVCLQTAFIDRELLTGNDSDGRQAVQALFGLINGIHVVGSPFQLEELDPDDGDQGEANVAINLALGFESTTSNILIGCAIIIVIASVLFLIVYKCKTRNANSVTDSQKTNAFKRIRRRKQLRLEEAGVNVEEQNQLFQDENAPADGEFRYAPLRIIEYDQWVQLNFIDDDVKAFNAHRELRQQTIEEADQAAIGMNRVIAAEVNQTNLDRQRLRDIDLQSTHANRDLDILQRNINSNQATILSQDKVLNLSSSQQNHLATNITQEQLQEQRLEEKENADPNFEDNV